MASGDLTQSLSKSLDRHLVFPLLEFLMNKELYKESDIQKAKIALLANTNMVDYAMDIYESLYGQGSAPQAMTEQREQVTPGVAACLLPTPPLPQAVPSARQRVPCLVGSAPRARRCCTS